MGLVTLPDLVVDGSVTRQLVPGGPLAALDLQDGTNYEFISVSPGDKSWRRESATSPFTHGRTLIGATLDVELAEVMIRVKGTSMSHLDSNLAALLRAFEQFAYALTIVIDGVTWTWQCEPADYTLQLSKFHMMARIHEVTFTVPRNPIPTAGSV